MGPNATLVLGWSSETVDFFGGVGRCASSCDVLSLLSSGSLSLFVCAYTLRTVILLCLMGSAEWNRQRGGLIPVLSCPKERLSAKAD